MDKQATVMTITEINDLQRELTRFDMYDANGMNAIAQHRAALIQALVDGGHGDAFVYGEDGMLSIPASYWEQGGPTTEPVPVVEPS